MDITLPYFSNYPILQRDEILMRQVVMSDIPNIIELTYYDAKPATSSEEAIRFHEKINQDFKAGQCYNWLIIDQSIDKIVGTCSYHGGFDNKTGELGCVLKQQYRGKGYMTKALELAIDFGFDVLALEKIIAVTTKTNEKAITLLERIGFSLVENIDSGSVTYQRERA